MRLLFPTAAAIVLLGYGTSLAQVAAVPNTTMPPISTLAPASTQAPAFPGTVNAPQLPGSVAGTLGTAQFNLGSPIGGRAPGAIQICPVTGTAAATANFPVDATDATTNAAPGFGTPGMSGSCVAGTPASSPGIITQSQFSDGAVLTGATEAGGPGLSPLIAGPYTPTTSCASVTAAMPEVPTPYDSVVAAQSGC